MINVQSGSVAEETFHINVGITEEGHRDILDYRVYLHGGTTNYIGMLKDLYERRLEQVLLIVYDSLSGIKEAFLE